MWTEYLNRLLGVAVGFLILATTISAWRHHRRDPRILWSTVAAFLLVGFEGWLGGRVVVHGLTPWIVTAHLMVALVIVQLLLYATYASGALQAPKGALGVKGASGAVAGSDCRHPGASGVRHAGAANASMPRSTPAWPATWRLAPLAASISCTATSRLSS